MGKPREWILLSLISIVVSAALVILILKFVENPRPSDFGMAVLTGIIVPVVIRFIRWVVNQIDKLEVKFTENIERIDDRLDAQSEKISEHEGRFKNYDHVFDQFEQTRKNIEQKFEETMTLIEKRLDIQDIKVGLGKKKGNN